MLTGHGASWRSLSGSASFFVQDATVTARHTASLQSDGGVASTTPMHTDLIVLSGPPWQALGTERSGKQPCPEGRCLRVTCSRAGGAQEGCGDRGRSALGVCLVVGLVHVVQAPLHQQAHAFRAVCMPKGGMQDSCESGCWAKLSTMIVRHAVTSQPPQLCCSICRACYLCRMRELPPLG